MKQVVQPIMALYGLEKEIQDAQRFGSGHIHQTFKVEGADSSYILQEFNSKVFPYPERMTANLNLLKSQLPPHQLPFLLPLPLANLSGQLLSPFQGKLYRLFPYVEGISVDKVNKSTHAQLAARAFGTFIYACQDLAPRQFAEVIPGFHDLSLRFQQLQSSIRNHPRRISPMAKDLIEFYLDHSGLVQTYQYYTDTLPLRLTHNDTKINNLIFKHDFSQVNALIDLDTVMPGYTFYDFGDLVRTAACTLDESSQNWQDIAVNLEHYQALLNGFLEGFEGGLGEEERSSLVFGGEMMTYIMGLRFLTDYLNGNLYYAIHYPGQNLHRAKNQMCLLRSLQEHRGIIEDFLKG